MTRYTQKQLAQEAREAVARHAKDMGYGRSRFGGFEVVVGEHPALVGIGQARDRDGCEVRIEVYIAI